MNTNYNNHVTVHDVYSYLQKENADKEKEKEKQERIEASLREREREVRASQAELAKAREKEKEQHLRDKAEQHFNALLADMVRADCRVLKVKRSTYMYINYNIINT